MRLFIGIELPEHVRQAAASVAADLRHDIRRAAPRTVARWVPAGNLHITVWFLGEVQDADTEALIRALKEPLGTGPVPLEIAGAGAFPPSGPPRATWLGLTEGVSGLVAVHDQLRDRLTPLGFEPEKRAYSSHLTIARVKEAPRAEVPAIRRVLRDARFEPIRCTVTHATLFRSRTLPDGSQYEALLRVPLI